VTARCGRQKLASDWSAVALAFLASAHNNAGALNCTT